MTLLFLSLVISSQDDVLIKLRSVLAFLFLVHVRAVSFNIVSYSPFSLALSPVLTDPELNNNPLFIGTHERGDQLEFSWTIIHFPFLCAVLGYSTEILRLSTSMRPRLLVFIFIFILFWCKITCD